MHFSENCHYLFLSIIISPLRIYCGQERFLDRAGWTWKAWDFFCFSVHLKVQMLLLKSFIWPNGLENHMKIPVFLGAVLKHTRYTIASLDTSLLLLLASDETMTWRVRRQAKKCIRHFIRTLKGLVDQAVGDFRWRVICKACFSWSYFWIPCLGFTSA